jgi:hypothetical protein
MPQLQNVILKDRAATPKDHTFTPRNIADGVGETVETTGVPVGESRFTIGMRRVNDRYKATMKLAIPVVVNQTINGVTTPVVDRVAYADVKFDFSAKSTEQERNDIVGMLQSAFDPSKVLVNDTVVKLQGVF